jgi:hypothetical protein
MKKPNSDLRLFLGEINFRTYQRIEAEARDLQGKLRDRSRARGPGRPKRDDAALTDVREAALVLLEECACKHVPPPVPLVRLFYELSNRRPRSRTGEQRAVQFKVAAEAEVAELIWDGQRRKIEYGAKRAHVAAIAGVDPKTISDWRRTQRYCRAVVEACARQLSQRENTRRHRRFEEDAQAAEEWEAEEQGRQEAKRQKHLTLMRGKTGEAWRVCRMARS